MKAEKGNKQSVNEQQSNEVVLEPIGSKEVPFEIHNQADGRTRLRVQFDITYKGTPGKTPDGSSDTVPDMTLSLGQLLERHSRGRDIPMQTPLYFDTEIPTFSDLTDVDRYRDQLERRLAETEKFINDEQKYQAQQEAQNGDSHAANELTPSGAGSNSEKANSTTTGAAKRSAGNPNTGEQA